MASLRITQRSRNVYWTVPAFIVLAAMVAAVLWGLTAFVGGAAKTAGATGSVELNGATTVAVSPSSIEITSGNTTIVSFTVNSVNNLYGAQFAARFPTATLAVVDADPVAAGVQIIPGPIWPVSPTAFVAQNTANNSSGVISYAAILVAPTSPFTGSGVIASAVISAKSVASRTCGSISYTWTGLADPNGDAISHSTVSGTVCVNPPPGVVVRVGSAYVISGGSFAVPVTVEDVPTTSLGLSAYEFDINYNSSVVNISGCSDSALTSLVCGTGTPGVVNAVAFSNTGRTGTFRLFNLNGNAVGAGGTSTPLTLTINALGDPGANEITPRSAVNGLISVLAAPVAGFSGAPTIGVAPLTVYFTDTSSGPPTSWLWSFGDGGTSTLPNPSRVYSAQGTYTVILTASNSVGSSVATRTAYIDVYTTPVVSFTASPTSGMSPLTVTFTDTSSNRPSSRLWSFGDGGSSTSQNPTHTYSSTGAYTVALRATNIAGTGVLTRTGYVNVINLLAATSLVKGVNVSGSNRYAVISVTVDRIYRPDTSETQTLEGGLGAFEGLMTFNSACITGVGVSAGIAPFSNTIGGVTTGSISYLGYHTETTGPQSGTLAVIKVRLTGAATETCTITNTFVDLGSRYAVSVPQDAADTITVRRGDAQSNNNVQVYDAMFIAQYVAGIIGAGSIDPVSAASVRYDGAGGDTIGVYDAMFIAQYRAGIKNAWYQ